MKKLTIVTDTWVPNVNGVVTSISHIQQILQTQNCAVAIIQPADFPTIRLPTDKELRLSLATRRKIEKLIRQQKPDFIHLATEGPLGLSARFACLKNRWHFTAAYHTRLPEYIQDRLHSTALAKLSYDYLRWFHNAADRTLVSTESLKTELAGKKIINLAVSPLVGVDIQLFKKNPEAKLPEGWQKPVFVFFGRLAPEKNLPAFLDLDLPGTKLVMGEGPQKPFLEKTYGKTTKFMGILKQQALVDVLSVCDVMVFPSKTDTFGLVMIEALACGLPVAAYNVSGPKDIIEIGVDGYMGDDLKSAALACLKLKGENCRKKAEQFSWESASEKFLAHQVASQVI